MTSPRPGDDPLAHLRHELRTPINHILGYGEMLIEDAEDRDGPDLDRLRAIHGLGKALLASIEAALHPADGQADLPALHARLSPDLASLLADCDSLASSPDPSSARPPDFAVDLDRVRIATGKLAALADRWLGDDLRSPAPDPG